MDIVEECARGIDVGGAAQGPEHDIEDIKVAGGRRYFIEQLVGGERGEERVRTEQ
uniref:Uncharacterized protein n=1 Tax=Arundo donax TaxID=35708 RepID=A0A0A9F5K4_ARUDO